MRFSFKDVYPDTKIVFSTTQAAKMMNDPSLRGNTRFRRFLRDKGLIDGDYPVQEFVDRGYFIVEYRGIAYGKYRVPVIKVTLEGIHFIKELVQ